MALKTFTIGNSLNESLSVGDFAYYVTLATAAGGFQSSTGSITSLGEVKAITKSTNTITVNVSTTIDANTLNNKMLLFSKDNKVNTSGLSGYYAEVKMANSSTTQAELYAVNSEVVQSSK